MARGRVEPRRELTQFWRHIGVPILFPSLLSAMVLLFGNSFAAYATAYGLTGGGIGLVPITIGFFLGGDVLDDPHLGQALALACSSCSG